MADRLPSDVQAAARLLLEHCARASVAPTVASLGEVQSVFVVRSGGLDQLGTFLARLWQDVPAAEIRVLGRPGDAAVLPQVWPGRTRCYELVGDGPLAWEAVRTNEPLCAAARACDAHVFLMRNASAIGYDNIQAIMGHLAGERWFGVTPDDRLVQFESATLGALHAHAALRDAIVEWASRLPPA
ncbi:MAG: hypothetical protein ABI211_24945 [Vicinamibacterales bacterium]